MDLQNIRQLIVTEARLDARRRELTKELEEATRERDELRNAIQIFMGSETDGYLDGRLVLTNRPKGGESFAKAQFRTKYPELAQMFTVKRVKEDLDMEALRRLHPDVVAEFQNRYWSNEVLG